jgi:NADP-dependent 3-hydroxy acid dehydrogenase YdfG
VPPGTTASPVALVAGASGGIGAAIAAAAASAGMRVAVFGRSAARLAELAICREKPGDCLVTEGDATSVADVDSAVAATLRRWGRLDVLVNAVGGNTPERTITEISDDEWQALVDNNVKAAFILTRAVIPAMRRQHSGTIVHVSSMAARRPGRANVAYQAAKAAVASLAQATLAQERQHGIRVTAVFPGLTDTPLLRHRIRPPSAESLAMALQPEDVAQACLLAISLPARACVSELTIVPRTPEVR